jgi:hypothetical protein
MMTGRQDDQSATRYPTVVDPGNWIVDTALTDRPGVGEIMLDLRYDIRGNGPTFKAMQQFLRDRQPPTLVAAGVNARLMRDLLGRVLAPGLGS